MSGGGTTRSTPDRGTSFVETLTAVVLLGVITFPLFDAVIGAVTSSSTARSATKAVSVLQDASDRINRADLSCDYTAHAVAAAEAKGWPASSVTVTHHRFEPAATPVLGGAWAAGACIDGVVPIDGVQSVQVTVRPPGTPVSRTMQVVKSNV